MDNPTSTQQTQQGGIMSAAHAAFSTPPDEPTHIDDPNVPADPPANSSGQPASTQAGATGGAATGAASQTPPSTGQTGLLTPDQIAEVLKKAGVGQQQQQAPQQPVVQPQYTEADFNRIFQVFQPNKTHLARFKQAIIDGDEAAGLEVLAEMSNAIARQAVTMSGYQLQQQMEQLNERFNPLQQYYIEQQKAALWQEFYTKYPDLAPFQTIAEAVVEQMKNRGFSETDKGRAMEALATEMKAILSRLPNNGQNGQQQGQQQPATTSKMSTLTSGGQGGAGGGRGTVAQAGHKRAAHAVFG